VIEPDDVGGVHIKYLYHCKRQLWLYARGIRPEHLNSRVQLGEAVHETSYTRSKEIDLGAARIDYIDGDAWVHEVKSSASPTPADEAQALHYCHRLDAVGIEPRGAVLHYPKTRRTVRLPYTPERDIQAATDISTVLATVAALTSPPRLPRAACRGCSYLDYCWME
jgi:CRISPR-associated exonuclease Cas4